MHTLSERICVRIGEDRALIDQVCKARGEDLSDFVRRALRRELARYGLLDAEEAKLLEG